MLGIDDLDSYGQENKIGKKHIFVQDKFIYT